MSGTAVSSEPVRATKNAPLMPEVDVGEAERLDDEVAAAAPRSTRSAPVRNSEDRQRRRPTAAEDALLEPVVQLEDPVRERQPDEDPPAEVAHA